MLNCDFRSVGALSSQQRGSGKQTAFAVRLIQWQTSEHHILSRPRLSVRMFGSWSKKRANASSNCAAL
jgi:hypothetical protein